jgi:hypothetical protein
MHDAKYKYISQRGMLRGRWNLPNARAIWLYAAYWTYTSGDHQDHRSPLNARRWYLSGLLLPARENRRLQKFYRYDVRMWFESRLVMCIEAALIHAQSQIQFAIIIISMSRVLFCELFSSTKLYFCREMRQFRWRCRPILNSTCRPQKLDAK